MVRSDSRKRSRYPHLLELPRARMTRTSLPTCGGRDAVDVCGDFASFCDTQRVSLCMPVDFRHHADAPHHKFSPMQRVNGTEGKDSNAK